MVTAYLRLHSMKQLGVKGGDLGNVTEQTFYSDQHQISPYNINAYSIPEVVRIKDMITQGESS